jgi:tetratricopeptide (TPR) repeat protein
MSYWFCSLIFIVSIFAASPAALAEKADNDRIAKLNSEGISALDKGKYRKAITLLYDAHKLDRDNAIVRQNLATAYNNYGTSLIENEVDQAIKMLKLARRFDGENQDIRLNLAASYNQKAINLLDKSNYNAAENYLLSAIKHDPDNTTLRKNLSVVYTEQGKKRLDAKKLQLALNKFNMALSYDGENAYAYLYAGDLYYQNQQLSAAIYSYENALRLNPEFSALDEKIDKLVAEQQVEDKLARATHRIFDVRYDHNNRSIKIDRILRLLDDAYVDIGRMLNYYPKHKVVVLLYAADDFKKIRQTPHWVGGLYDGKIRLPYSKDTFDRKQLRRIIRHEYTHALVQDLANGNCSIWLNEGLAKFMEYSDNLNKFKLDELKKAYRNGNMDSIADLEQDFLKISDDYRAALVYQESFSIVRYIDSTYGFWKLQRMLDAFGKGYSSAEVIRLEFYQTPDQFERSWIGFLDQLF